MPSLRGFNPAAFDPNRIKWAAGRPVGDYRGLAGYVIEAFPTSGPTEADTQLQRAGSALGRLTAPGVVSLPEHRYVTALDPRTDGQWAIFGIFRRLAGNNISHLPVGAIANINLGSVLLDYLEATPVDAPFAPQVWSMANFRYGYPWAETQQRHWLLERPTPVTNVREAAGQGSFTPGVPSYADTVDHLCQEIAEMTVNPGMGKGTTSTTQYDFGGNLAALQARAAAFQASIREN